MYHKVYQLTACNNTLYDSKRTSMEWFEGKSKSFRGSFWKGLSINLRNTIWKLFFDITTVWVYAISKQSLGFKSIVYNRVPLRCSFKFGHTKKSDETRLAQVGGLGKIRSAGRVFGLVGQYQECWEWGAISRLYSGLDKIKALGTQPMEKNTLSKKKITRTMLHRMRDKNISTIGIIGIKLIHHSYIS